MPDPKPHVLDCDLYTSNSSYPFPKGSTVHLDEKLAGHLVDANLARRVPTQAEAQATVPVPAGEHAETATDSAAKTQAAESAHAE